MIHAGVDIGDRRSQVCLVAEIDGEPEVIEEATIPTTRRGITSYFAIREPMIVVMEVGTHSPWLSKLIGQLGHRVIVANASRLHFIFKNDKKCDRIDAEMLARVARLDPALLHPIEHRDEVDAEAMALLRSRDALVRARTDLINHVRGIVKSNGERLPTRSARGFESLKQRLPEELLPSLGRVMDAIGGINARIKELERSIDEVSEQKYPETQLLRQVHGVGPITALAYVLVICNPERFAVSRRVGSYIGLVGRRRQSSGNDPDLPITRGGHPYLRRLLVCSAQHILGPFGRDSDLRRYGERILERGGKRARNRAVVAVARKLSVLLLTLLKTGEEYDPLYQEHLGEQSAA